MTDRGRLLLLLGGTTAVFAVGAFLIGRRRGSSLSGWADSFQASGRPKPIGLVEDYGTTRSATIYVGQDRGLQPANRGGSCARKPKSFAIRSVDQSFLNLRERQVGKENTGATRTTGRGWYQGKPEKAAAYEVVFIPNDREPSYDRFRQNINLLAETVGREFCQDSVIVVHNDGGRRNTCAATWFQPGDSTC